MVIVNFMSLEGLFWQALTPHIEIIYAVLFVLGGCFGSFANAAAMRLVRDESPITPLLDAVFVTENWDGEKICLYWDGCF